jgi:tyrosine-protein phosphatase non-receptor type 4
VPSNLNLFLDFTERVRVARNTTLLHEIEETLKQVRLKDADENGGLDGERKNYENGESPCDLPPSTSVHQCISAANPPIIIHCSGKRNLPLTFAHLNLNFLILLLLLL